MPFPFRGDDASPRDRRTARLSSVAAVFYAASVVSRAQYILISHHPRHHATSDARDLLEVAARLLERANVQNIGDTIWPPGAPSFLALGLLVDPTLGIAAALAFAQSCLIPLLVGHTAYLVAGRRAASAALLLASLHFGFVHYAGFFLSELPFQFTATLAVWASVLALRVAEARPSGGSLRRERAEFLGLGLAAGLCWGLATCFRPNALAMAASIGTALLVRFLARGRRRFLPLVAGAALGFVLVLAPLAHRCSRLKGGFCPVSTNIAMNMVLGQAGEVEGFTFKNPKHPELTTSWAPPALLQHGYRSQPVVPFSIYETGAALGWLQRRFVDDPGAFLVRAAGNVFDLFRLEYWPDDYDGLGERSATVLKQAFLLFAIVPGLLGAWLLVRRPAARRSESAIPTFLLACLGALAVVAAVSMGEARYRIPFDGVFVVFAAAFFTQVSPASPRFAFVAERRGSHLRALVAAGALAAAGAAIVVAVSHPASLLAARLNARRGGSTASVASKSAPAADYAERIASGRAWDDPKNYRFVCKPHCKELVLRFDTPQRSRRLEISTDHNDWYEVRYYLRGNLLAHETLPQRWGKGMLTRTLAVPKSVSGSFDAVGVVPLYGDGRYALGHLRPG